MERRRSRTGTVDGRGIVKSYPGGGRAPHTVLHGIDLHVPQGALCTILGPSGSGKSTLMRCLAGLETIDAGEVTVGGSAVHGLTDAQTAAFRRDTIAFVFQDYNLIADLTLAENIGLDREIAEDTRERARAWGIGDVLDHFPAQCSGGQQQKAAILRALNKQCQVIFCDEPTGALDSTSATDVLEALSEARDANTTIVMVTHNELMTEISDIVVRLHNGLIESVTAVPNPRRVSEVEW